MTIRLLILSTSFVQQYFFKLTKMQTTKTKQVVTYIVNGFYALPKKITTL